MNELIDVASWDLVEKCMAALK